MTPGRGSASERPIVVPASFREMPRWWDDQGGRRWLDALPVLVAEQCRRWQLRVDGAPFHGSNALVVPVVRGDLPLALRLVAPGDAIDAEAAALRFWDGRGTVRLVDADEGRGAMLLERLDGSTSLQSVPLADAIPVVARLVGELAVPAPASVRSTAAIAAEYLDTFGRDWALLDGPTPPAQLETALRLAQELASSDTSDLAVDGDLHCEQVLAADRAPWLVVDPVLYRGDREFDLARVLWSRLDEVPDDAEVLSLFDLFVRHAQVPSDRARSWVVLRSMSYLLWGLQHGLTLDPPKCLRLLTLFS